jgi:hypothetical protein
MASSETSSRVAVAPTASGCCIRVDGRGTMKHSPAAHAIAARALAADGHGSVVFDLSQCEYLDSTFLGVLIGLYREFSRNAPGAGSASAPSVSTGTPRYAIAALPDVRKKLLGPTHLDRLIPMLDAPPATIGPWTTLAEQALDRTELTRHVMQAHRALAQTDCPMRDVFAKIADQMEAELKR